MNGPDFEAYDRARGLLKRMDCCDVAAIHPADLRELANLFVELDRLRAIERAMENQQVVARRAAMGDIG